MLRFALRLTNFYDWLLSPEVCALLSATLVFAFLFCSRAFRVYCTPVTQQLHFFGAADAQLSVWRHSSIKLTPHRSPGVMPTWIKPSEIPVLPINFQRHHCRPCRRPKRIGVVLKPSSQQVCGIDVPVALRGHMYDVGPIITGVCDWHFRGSAGFEPGAPPPPYRSYETFT